MEKVGRNDPCPCGSGKKHKKCCEIAGRGRKIQAEVVSASQSQETRETSKISSLFFQRAAAPKAAVEAESAQDTVSK